MTIFYQETTRHFENSQFQINMSSSTAGASVFLNFLQSCSVFVTVQSECNICEDAFGDSALNVHSFASKYYRVVSVIVIKTIAYYTEVKAVESFVLHAPGTFPIRKGTSLSLIDKLTFLDWIRHLPLLILSELQFPKNYSKI